MRTRKLNSKPLNAHHLNKNVLIPLGLLCVPRRVGNQELNFYRAEGGAFVEIQTSEKRPSPREMTYREWMEAIEFSAKSGAPIIHPDLQAKLGVIGALQGAGFKLVSTSPRKRWRSEERYVTFQIKAVGGVYAWQNKANVELNIKDLNSFDRALHQLQVILKNPDSSYRPSYNYDAAQQVAVAIPR